MSAARFHPSEPSGIPWLPEPKSFEVKGSGAGVAFAFGDAAVGVEPEPSESSGIPSLPCPNSFEFKGSDVGVAFALGDAGVGVDAAGVEDAIVEKEVAIVAGEEEEIGEGDGEACAMGEAEGDADGCPAPLLLDADCC